MDDLIRWFTYQRCWWIPSLFQTTRGYIWGWLVGTKVKPRTDVFWSIPSLVHSPTIWATHESIQWVANGWRHTIYIYIFFFYIHIHIYIYHISIISLHSYLDLLKMILNYLPSGKWNTWGIYRALCFVGGSLASPNLDCFSVGICTTYKSYGSDQVGYITTV